MREQDSPKNTSWRKKAAAGAITVSAIFMGQNTNHLPNTFLTPEHTNQNNVLHIAALGDSITAAAGLQASDSYANILAQSLSERTGKQIKVTNLAIKGLRTQDLTEKLKTNLAFNEALTNADLIVLDIGTNDFLQGKLPYYWNLAGKCEKDASDLDKCLAESQTNFKKDWDDLISVIQKKTDKPIVVLDLYYPSFSIDLERKDGVFTIFRDFLLKMDAIIDQSAKDKNMCIVKVSNLFNGESIEKDAVEEGLIIHYPDGVHPTLEGQKQIASLIINTPC